MESQPEIIVTWQGWILRSLLVVATPWLLYDLAAREALFPIWVAPVAWLAILAVFESVIRRNRQYLEESQIVLGVITEMPTQERKGLVAYEFDSDRGRIKAQAESNNIWRPLGNVGDSILVAVPSDEIYSSTPYEPLTFLVRFRVQPDPSAKFACGSGMPAKDAT